jgi:MFS family permease
VRSARGKAWSITLLAVCEVLAMTLWFSASAVVPSLRLEYEITGLHASLLSSSVSAGFVVGTLVSAILDLADRADPRRLFMVSAILAAGATELIAMAEPTSAAVIGLRFAVGVCMAGIYPIGMKLVATWAKAIWGCSSAFWSAR